MQQRAAVIEPDHSSDSSGSCLNRIVKVGDNLKHDVVYVVESLRQTVTEPVNINSLAFYKPLITEASLDDCEVIPAAGDFVIVFGYASDHHSKSPSFHSIRDASTSAESIIYVLSLMTSLIIYKSFVYSHILYCLPFV